MEIKLKELERMLLYLFKQADLRSIDHLKLDNDFYWNIDTAEKFDLSKKPKLDIGSLQDDFKSLQLLLERKHAASVVDIERLGNLLIYLSVQILNSDKVFY